MKFFSSIFGGLSKASEKLGQMDLPIWNPPPPPPPPPVIDATLRQMIESYIGSGLRGKAPSVSLDAIRERAATLARQGVPRADIEATRVAAEEAAKVAYNDELRRAVDSLLSIWGTTNARGSHQRVIRDFTDAADSVPVNPTGTDDERLQWALQVLQGGAQAYPFFSKRGFGGWQEAVTPLTRIYAPAARIYPEWIPDYEVISETGVPEPGPVDYSRWVPIARQLGFSGQTSQLLYDYETGASYPGPPSAAFRQFVDAKRLEGFDFVAHRGNFHNYNNLFGFKLPNGEVVGQTRTGDDDDVVSFVRSFVIPVFSIAGGFAFLGGQIAGFTGIPANYASGFLRAAVATAGGQDVDRALLSALGPVVIQDILPPTVWQAPDLGTIEPELLAVGDELIGAVEDVSIVAETAEVFDSGILDLVTAPELLPEPLPAYMDDFEIQAPPPVAVELEFFETPELPIVPASPVIVAEIAPESTSDTRPAPERAWWRAPVRAWWRQPVLQPPPEPVAELLAPPDLLPEPPAPTIEPIGAPIMEDFFTVDDYAFSGGDGGFDFDFDTLDPIPTVDAGEWFVGPMPLPDFPAIEEDFIGAPIEGITTEEDLQNLVTVGDISTVTVDELANYTGTGTGGAGGIVETGGTAAGTTVVQVLKEATGAMVAALGLVQAYRALTSKPAPNPVVQARQGQNTVRANPNGTIVTTSPDGRTRTARPPVGQPQMATDGSMIVNNGDGTYTRISRDGQSVVNRYPLDITERIGAAASSPYALPLLIGGAALVLFATRKR